MNTATYFAAEKRLTENGFKKETGMPLSGVRFSSQNMYAIVLRMGDNNYETSFYAKKSA